MLLNTHPPKVHGFVLRQIKDDGRTRMIPLVVLTASQRGRDIREARGLSQFKPDHAPVAVRRGIAEAERGTG